MADAYLKVKDNGAQGLSLVREEADITVDDLKNASVVDNVVGGETANIFNYGSDAYRGTSIKTTNGVVTIDGTANTGNGQYKLTGTLAHSVGGSSWVSDTLALIPGHRYALAINVYGGTYTHPSGSTDFPEVRLYGSDYAVPVLSVPIADESGLIKGTQISRFSVYNDNNLRYITFFVVNGGVYGKLKIKIALIDLNDLDALIDNSNVAQTGYYEEIIYQGVKNYTDTGGEVSRYYAAYIPKYDSEGNIIPLLPDYSTTYSPNEYAMANYTTVTINAGMTTGETGNGAVIRNGEIIRESDYTTAGNYLLHLGIDADRDIKEYPRNATCAEMMEDGVVNAFLAYYPLIHDGVILDFDGMNLPETNYNKSPRMMILERANGVILFVAVDGRTKQSAGLTPRESAELCLSLNAVNAWQIDGGGSTSLSLKGVKLNANIDGSGLVDRDIHVTVNVPRKRANQAAQRAGSYLGLTHRDEVVFFQRQINTINNILNYIAQEAGIDISDIT